MTVNEMDRALQEFGEHLRQMIRQTILDFEEEYYELEVGETPNHEYADQLTDKICDNMSKLGE